MKTFKKDPNETRQFGCDWTDLLADIGDTIESVTWVVESGLTGGTESTVEGITSKLFSGGTNGVTYTVTARITTLDRNEIYEESFDVQVVDSTA